MVAKTSQKYGRPNEATPAKWNAEYKDFDAPLENGTAAPAKRIEPATVGAGASDEQKGTAVVAKLPSGSQPSLEKEGDSKKRKRHEGETEEERAERKRKKKDKKEKRKSKPKKGESDDDSS